MTKSGGLKTTGGSRKALRTTPTETFRVEIPRSGADFTGERYVAGVGGPVEYEHFHRYIMALAYCWDKAVLDIASGDGYGSNLLATAAGSVVGVDIDHGAVASAAARYVRPNLRYQQGSATSIPLPDASVDVVVSFETLEHIVEHDEFLAECRRVLKPDGTLVMSTPDKEIYSPEGSPPNPYHLKELTRAEFEALITRHFGAFAMFGQSPVFGSVIAPMKTGVDALDYLEEREPAEYVREDRVRSPTYLIAVAGSAVDAALANDAVNLLNAARSGLPQYVDLAERASRFEQEVVRLNTEVGYRDTAIERLERIVREEGEKAIDTVEQLAQRDQIAAVLRSRVESLDQQLSAMRDIGGDLQRKLSDAEARLIVEVERNADVQATTEASQFRFEAMQRTYRKELEAAYQDSYEQHAVTARVTSELARVRLELQARGDDNRVLAQREAAALARIGELEALGHQISSDLVAARAAISDMSTDAAEAARRLAAQTHPSSPEAPAGPANADSEARIRQLEDALCEAEAQVAALQMRRQHDATRLNTLEHAVRSLTTEINHWQNAMREVRSSTSWMLARAFVRAGSYAPASLKRIGRAVLSRMAKAVDEKRRKAAAEQMASASSPLAVGATFIPPATLTPAPPAAVPAAKAGPVAASSLGSDAAPVTVAKAVLAPRMLADDITHPDLAGDVTIVAMLDNGKPPSDAMLAALRRQAEAGVDVIVASSGTVRVEGVISLPAPKQPERVVEELDRLIRAASTPNVIVLTEDVVLDDGALEATAAFLAAGANAIAANGLIEGAPLDHRPDFSDKSTQSSTGLRRGVLLFDVDAYALVGGLRAEDQSLAAALQHFSRRAEAAGFKTMINPQLCARPAPGGLPADLPMSASPTFTRQRRQALVADVVTPTPDRDCGSLNLVWIIRILQSAGYEVTFLSHRERGHAGRYTDDLRAMGVRCPLGEDYEEAWRYLQAEGERFDLVMLFRVPAACHLIDAARQFAPRAKVVFNTVDLHFLRESRAAELAGSQSMMENAEATKREEIRVMRQSDATVVVSRFEKELLAEMVPEVRSYCIPIVNPIAGLMGPAAGRTGVMFVGGFGHSPNLDAVMYFASEVWPRVREQAPDQTFHIIGSSPPEQVRALHSEANGISVEGFIENLGPWYKRMRVNVAPLRFGGGIKGKVIASLSVGLPTVGTPIAVEGMGLTHGENVFVAEDPAAFAAQVVALCRDDDTWNRVAKASVGVARELYSVESVEKATLRMLRDIGL